MMLYPADRLSETTVWNEDQKAEQLAEAKRSGFEWVASRRVTSNKPGGGFVDGCYIMVFVERSCLRKR